MSKHFFIFCALLLPFLIQAKADYNPSNTIKNNANLALNDVYFVNPDAAGDGSGLTWANAFTNLQTAFNTVPATSEIWVKGGIYFPDGGGVTDHFTISNFIFVYGGFAGDETLLSQRNLTINPTILSGDYLQNDLPEISFNDTDRSENAQRVLVVSGSRVDLDGLIIEGGHAIGNTSTSNRGSAIFKENTTNFLSLTNCTIRDNVGSLIGAVYADFNQLQGNDVKLSIDRCIFQNNLARLAASLYVRRLTGIDLSVPVTNCLFTENRTENNASGTGFGGTAAFVNNSDAGNGTQLDVDIVNCTFAYNQDVSTGSGNPQPTLFMGSQSPNNTHFNALVANSIFYTNVNGNGTDLPMVGVGNNDYLPYVAAYDNFAPLAFSGLTDVFNNTTDDPEMTDAMNGDFTLVENGAAVDYGDNFSIPEGIEFDLAGNSRIIDGSVDAGAYESGEDNVCTVDIPDANFLNALVNNTNINTDGNGTISCAEAENFSEALIVNSLNISDMTGIEAFTNITSLVAYANNFSELNVSNNTELLFLNLGGTNLTSLDLTGNTLLEFLNIGSCNFSNLDISQNPQLKTLYANNNGLTAINISNNTLLETCVVSQNFIDEIDFSQSVSLKALEVQYNNLTSLDLTNCDLLETLDGTGNELTTVDLRNGNSTNLTSLLLTANDDLECVNVDDAAYATANFTAIPPETIFSTDCDNPSTATRDAHVMPLKIYPNPVETFLNVDLPINVKRLEVFTIQGQVVRSFLATECLNVRDLPAGLYQLRAEDMRGAVYRVAFSKL